MNLGRYQLLTQLGTGPDGISYKAQDQQSKQLTELRLLHEHVRESARFPGLVKRLKNLILLRHPASLLLQDLHLEEDPPFVALEWVEDQELAQLHELLSLPAPRVLILARGWAQGLADAHRLGLAHGSLNPAGIRWVSQGVPKIDFTRIQTFSSTIGKLEAFCLAPEPLLDDSLASAADVYSLGAILVWLLTGRPALEDLSASPLRLLTELPPDTRDSWKNLLQSMLSVDPGERPLAGEVETALARLQTPAILLRTRDVLTDKIAPANLGNLTPTIESLPLKADLDPHATREKAAPPRPNSDSNLMGRELGRYRLLDKLGSGGMGTVYRATDLSDGSVVAVKVLRADWTSRPQALRRFHKEARLLAEVNNPFVTQLLEVNEDKGIHYLVMEFVAGQDLGRLLIDEGKLDERTALAIMADVARALVDAHDRQIVHRDIKPENILLIPGGQVNQSLVSPSPSPFHVKLSDFGLARHVIETESLDVTQAGSIVGTPIYMAPEQCRGDKVDPRTDVYGMGATLFHMLTGRPPFLADTALALSNQHCNDLPPDLQSLNHDLSDGVSRIVAKALAKSPDARHIQAASLLSDLERLLRGEPANIAVHPVLPVSDPNKVLKYDWTWDLESSPEQLWPHVSNTERLNRAAGLTPVEFTEEKDEGSSKGSVKPLVRRFGNFRRMGVTASWEEHPFEWIEARRMGVVREYSRGPFKWLVSITELVPRAGGGTTLHHRVRIEPRGLIGRTLAAVEVGVKGKRAVERVYHRIDASLAGQANPRASQAGNVPLLDPFEEPNQLKPAQRDRLDLLLDKLGQYGIDPLVVERIGDFLAVASPQEVARIRPFALARRLALDPQLVIATCLHGAREGLLTLLWDILCPVCRIPSEIKDTLRALKEHGRCEACNLDFELDFANSVELIFRAHPEVRDTELRTYCIGGPAHSPHVVAQIRLQPGERLELELALSEGAYRLRGPQLPYAIDFRVQAAAGSSRWDLVLAPALAPDLPWLLRAGHQFMGLTNGYDQEIIARVERSAPRTDALTAARATSLALFRELFPGEILSPGQLVSVATITLLVTALDEADHLYEKLGDARAFQVLHEHFRLLEDCIRRGGGALIKTVGEGVVAVFQESVAAVAVGIKMQTAGAKPASEMPSLGLRVGVHRGPAMAATLNDHLDYFGTTVKQAVLLPYLARSGEVLLTQAVASDPQVAALMGAQNLSTQLIQIDLPGQPGALLHRLQLTPSAASQAISSPGVDPSN